MRKLVIAAVSLLALASTALAQKQTRVPAAPQKQVEATPLMRIIGDGVFALRQGQSIDLSKQQWLLTFERVQDRNYLEQGNIKVSVAGYAGYRVQPGTRINFKEFSNTRKDAEKYDSCFLDVTDVVSPKGAPATATFRFSCQ